MHTQTLGYNIGGGGWRHYHKKLLSLSLLRSLIHPTSPMASLLYTFLMSEMIRKNEVEGGGEDLTSLGGHPQYWHHAVSIKSVFLACMPDLKMHNKFFKIEMYFFVETFLIKFNYFK